MPCSNADRNLWLAYASAVKEASGFEPSYNVAMYLASNAQKGPFISPRIPAEYINARMYEACDNRLSPDNLFYNPASHDLYTKHLITYLASVDVGARGEVAHEIEQRFQDFETSLEASYRSREKALKTFKKHSESGMIGDLTFSQWHQTNAPAFCNAISNVEAASAALLSAGSVLIGPAAQRWNQDLRKVIDALTSDQSVPGISMMAENPSASKDQELLNAVVSGRKASAAKSAVPVPAYCSPEYEDILCDWIKAGPNEGLCDEFYVRYAEGEIADEGSFGQEAREGELDYDYPPWISFHVNGRDEIFKTGIRDGDVDITLRFERVRIIGVSSGAWDIENAASLYPRSKPNISKLANTLVRPQSLIVLNNLGFRILFRGRLLSEVEGKLKRSQGSGDYFTVFGVPVKLFGDNDTENASHVAFWSSKDGVLEVSPTADGAFATIVGTIGATTTR